MSEVDDPKKRSNQVMNITIITMLMIVGFVSLWSKVRRQEPVPFSDRNLPQATRQALALGNDGLDKADPHSLTLANLAFAQVMKQNPDYPPALAKWALTSAVLKTVFHNDKMDKQAAMRAADAVPAKYPDEKDALLAQAFLAGPDDAKLVAINANKVLKQERYDVYALYLLAQKSAHDGKHKLALRYAETLALQDPMALWLRAPRCRQAIAVGHREKAVTACEWAFGNQPESQQGRDLLQKAQGLMG